MTTTSVNVARNMCGDIPPVVPVNIDCSLCAMGFPQAGGQISIQFFGPICTPSTFPSPSKWLGYEPKYAQFKCPNPGQNQELDPNTWQATGYFSGAATGGCAQQYKYTATLTAVSEGVISLSIIVYVLKPTTGGNHWETYCSWTETLVEIANFDTTRYRSRAFQTPGYKSITVNENGGKGDPVSYVKTTAGMFSMRVGCDSTANAVPDTCGFWDGSQWLTCLRGFIKSTSDNSIREFTQLGFNATSCGTGTTYCTCDSITLTSTSPVAGTTTYNTNAAFVTKYGVLGLPGGIEAVGARQQLQISQGTTCGIEIVVKQVANGTIYICTNDNGAGWVVSAATVSQSNSPRILTATRSNFEVFLYALNFPNDQILASECSSGGSYPTGGGKWFCTYGRGCIQSPVQPDDAKAGPFDTETQCLETGCEEATYDPSTYWCLYGYCVQSPAAPLGYSSGPHATQAACIAACGSEPEMVWICGYDGGCSLTSKAEAFMNGYQWHPTQAECEANCPTVFWCTSEGCVQRWGDVWLFPPNTITGPFPDLDSCTNSCESGGAGFYCVGGTCDYYPKRPFGSIGPVYSTYSACNASCQPDLGPGYYCVANACGYYTSTPPGATAGPYATIGLCVINCAPAPETVSPFPITESDNNVVIKETKIDNKAKMALEVVKSPCIHLGRDLDASSCLPCGTPKRYECAIHGICTKLRKVKDAKMACVDCSDYMAQQ